MAAFEARPARRRAPAAMKAVAAQRPLLQQRVGRRRRTRGWLKSPSAWKKAAALASWPTESAGHALRPGGPRAPPRRAAASWKSSLSSAWTISAAATEPSGDRGDGGEAEPEAEAHGPIVGQRSCAGLNRTGAVCQRLPEVERGEAAVRAPGLADLQHLRRASASPPARTRSGSPCGCRGRRRRGRRGVRGGRAGTSPRSSWPSPRTATISSITSSSPSSSRRSSSSSPLSTWAARSRTYSTLRPERPAPRRSASLGLEQLLGRGRGAAEEVEHAQVDRPRRFGRELLADDRPQQGAVGVGRALLAAPSQPRRQVDLADPLDQRRHRRVGWRRAACAPSRSPARPLGLALLGEGARCPRGSPRRRSRTRAGRSGRPPAASLRTG